MPGYGDGRLDALERSGAVAAGYPKPLVSLGGGPISYVTPAAADVNGDGMLELVTALHASPNSVMKLFVYPTSGAVTSANLPWSAFHGDMEHTGLTATPLLRGDLNSDGQVTLADLRLLLRMLTGEEPPSAEAKALAVPSGQLTLADARALIQLLVTAGT